MDSDLFWHMATGRWIIENLEFPSSDMFSYVYRGASWINLPWVFQVVTFSLNQWLGYSGVLLLCTLVCTLSAVLTWKSFDLLLSSQKNDNEESHFQIKLFAFFIFSLFLFFLEKRWIARPEIFTGLFISLEVYIISRFSLNPQSTRLLWLLPLIQLIWVNSHGMFILGYALIGTTWLKYPKQMTGPTLLSAIASLGNPYGWEGALYPFYLREVSADPVYRLIREGTALFDYLTPVDSHVYWAIWLLSLPFSLKSGIKIFGKSYLLLMTFAIYFSTTMVRNLAPAVLMTLPFILHGLIATLATYLKKNFTIKSRSTNIIILSYTCIFSVLIATDAIQPLRTNFHFGTKISSSQELKLAAEFLTNNKLTHRVFATPEFSNYMLWFDPGFETYIDTRYAEVVPKNHFTQLFQRFLNPNEIELETAKYGIRTIALNHTLNNYHKAIQYFHHSADWHLVYFDHFMVIFLKKGYHDNLTLPSLKVEEILKTTFEKFDKLIMRRHSDYAEIYQIMVGAVILGHADLVTTLLPKVLDTGDIFLQKLYCAMITRKLTQSLSTSYVESLALQAKNVCKTAFEKSHDHSMAFNLGVAYSHLNMPAEAINYMKKASEIHPTQAQYYVAIAGVLASMNYIKNFEAIEKNYIKALDLDPFQINIWISLSLLYEQMGKNDDAYKNYDKALSFNRNDKNLIDEFRNFKGRIRHTD